MGYLSFCGEPCVSSFFSASTVPAYIFTALTSKATIISLEPCALNADFQHFIPRSNKIFLTLWYTWKKGLEWKEAQRQGDFTKKFSIYTYMPQNIYMGCVNVFDKYLHRPCVGVKNTYRHCNRISVSVNFFDV
jgi:hypothetical protein